jgi:hypothetical protein
MCKQPIPQVTDKDVKRIALRDFGEAQLFQVLSILGKFGKQAWNKPNKRLLRTRFPRRRAAVLSPPSP